MDGSWTLCWGAHNHALEAPEGVGWNWVYDEMLTGLRLGALCLELQRLWMIWSGILKGCLLTVVEYSRVARVVLCFCLFCFNWGIVDIVVVQLLSCIWLFVTPWIVSPQASLSIHWHVHWHLGDSDHWVSTLPHIYWVDDAIQPSHPLLPPSPPALNVFIYY